MPTNDVTASAPPLSDPETIARSDPQTTDPNTPGPFRNTLGRPEQLMRIRRAPAPEPTADQPTSPESRGMLTGVMTTGPWMLDPDGRPTGAATAVLIDHTLAITLNLARDGIPGMVTTELTLEFLRPLPADGTVLQSRTQARTVDEGGALATGSICGPDGAEYVRASGWFQFMAPTETDSRQDHRTAAALPVDESTAAPLGELLSLDPTSVPSAPTDEVQRLAVQQDFTQGLRFRRQDELRNPRGAVHGGVMTMMAGLAAGQAMPDRAAFEMQSLRVMFVRPGSGDVRARTRLRHAGRSLRLLDLELIGASGKPSVQAQAVFRGAR